MVNLKHKKLDLNNIPYSDKEETTISFKNDLSSNNINNQTINFSSSNNLEFQNSTKCNLKMKSSHMKNTIINTDSNTSNSNININNSSCNNNEIKNSNCISVCNSTNLNFYGNNNSAESNQFLISLPNNPITSGNLNKSTITTLNHELNIINNFYNYNNNTDNTKITKSSVNTLKKFAFSPKPLSTVTASNKINKNNRCNIVSSANSNPNSNLYNYNSQISKTRMHNQNHKQISKKLLNFSNNSINNNTNSLNNNNNNNNSFHNNNISSKTNNFAGSRKQLSSSNNNTLLVKQNSNILTYLNSNGNLNYNILNKNANDFSNIHNNNINKNKMGTNFLEESKPQPNVSYSFKTSEVIRIKPIKPERLFEAARKEIDMKIDLIITDNISKIKLQLDCLENYLREFEKETEFVKENL